MADGKDSGHDASWVEVLRDVPVGVDEVVTLACGAAGAWDGMTVGRDVEAGRQEGQALNPEIPEEKCKM